MFERFLRGRAEKTKSLSLDNQRDATGTIEHTPNQLMVRRFLDSMNESVLREIYEELGSKTGRKKNTLRFIPLSDIRIVDDPKIDFEGTYLPSAKQIHLNAARMASNPSLVLHCLIHEELHAVSDNSFIEKNVEKQSKTVTQNQRIGISRYTASETVSREFTGSLLIEDRYTVANEGITELVSDEILNLYLARTGDFDLYGRDQIAQTQETAQQLHQYSAYRRAVRMFTSIVATLADMPEDSVKQSITREYFQSNQILPMEIVDELERRQPGLGAKIHDILNCENPEISWKQISLDINDSPAFTDAEKNKIMSEALTLLDEELEYRNK